MAQLMTMARSLGLEPSGTEAPPREPEAPPASAPAKDPEADFAAGIFRLFREARADTRQDALLLALRPYLAPERQARLDRAMKLARLSHLAGAALQSYGGFSGEGGGHV